MFDFIKRRFKNVFNAYLRHITLHWISGSQPFETHGRLHKFCLGSRTTKAVESHGGAAAQKNYPSITQKISAKFPKYLAISIFIQFRTSSGCFLVTGMNKIEKFQTFLFFVFFP